MTTTQPTARDETVNPLPARLTRWAVIGIGGEVIFTAAWLVAGIVQGHSYSWIRDDISDLGAATAPHAWLFLVPQAVAGCATIGFALFGLRPALAQAGRHGWTGPWLAALCAVQDLSDGVLRLDCRAADGCTEAQAVASWHSQVHVGVGLIAVLLLVISPFVVGRRLRQLPDWQDLARPTRIVGILLGTGVLGIVAAQTAPVHGLIQRAVALIAAIWGVLLAVRLYHLARPQTPAQIAG